MSFLLSLLIQISMAEAAPAKRAATALPPAKGFSVKTRTGDHEVTYVLKSDPAKNWVLERHDNRAASGMNDVSRPDAAKLSAQFHSAISHKQRPAKSCPNNQIVFSGTMKTKTVCINRLEKDQIQFIKFLQSQFPKNR